MTPLDGLETDMETGQDPQHPEDDFSLHQGKDELEGEGPSEGFGEDQHQADAPVSRPRTRIIEHQEEEEEEEEEDEDDDDDIAGNHIEGMYDPEEFSDLNVSPEIRSLFGFIQRYSSHLTNLDTKLKPFIPEFIPSVGDTDPFIKVEYGEDSNKLGLRVLDEPMSLQSDSTILELKLRSMSKQTINKGSRIKKIQNADEKSKEVDKWISDIWQLHRGKPAPTVQYVKNMPDIDSLLQEWPGEVETLLESVEIPSADIDIGLENYAQLVCNCLDIPNYKSQIQSLHLLFTLYVTFINSDQFNFHQKTATQE